MGPLSWTLLLGALNGAVLCALLARAPGNRLANRFLALLLAAIALRLLIYVFGFAGLYDHYRWLTFAPLDASLAFGPALWLYVTTLTCGRPPERWPLHFAPAVLQLAYSAVAFALPVDWKMLWYGGPHLAIVEPVVLVVLLASCAGYLAAAWQRQRSYQRWLDERFGNREQWRLAWLSAILAAFATVVAAAIAAALFDRLVAPLNYFGRAPVVFALALLAYVLGLLGWRHADLALPVQTEAAEVLDPNPASTDLAVRFAEWSRRVEAQGWWRDEQLTLADLASRLNVSERTLSRGLNEGGGCNFNAFVNGFRVAAVQRAILASARDDLLTLALDHGFNSKASFNRAFRQHVGTSPSAWRATARNLPIAVSVTI